MTLVTYAPTPGYSGEKGQVNAGGGAAFDVGAALSAGGGQFTVDSSVNPLLISVLDNYPGVARFATTPGTPVFVDYIAPVVAHQANPSTGASLGDILVRGADGLFAPQPGQLNPVVNVNGLGGKGDGTYLSDGVMAAGSNVLTSASAKFAAPQPNQTILVSVPNAATFSTTGNTHGTTTIDGLPTWAVQGINVGAPITPTANIPANTTVTGILSPTSISISNAASTTATGVSLTFGTSLVTTITGLSGSNGVVLAASSVLAVTNARVLYGTDNRAAVQAAITQANGGAVLFPDGLYLANIYPGNVATPLTIIDGTTFVGNSRNGTNLRFWPEVSPVISGGAGYLQFLRLTGTQSLTVRDMTISGPDVFATGQSMNTGIDHTGTAGTVRLINALVKRFTYGLRKSPSAADSINYEVINSRLEGCGGNPGGTPMLVGAAGTGSYGSGKRVKLRNVEVANFGWIGSNQYHGLYFYTDNDVDVSGVTFLNQYGTGLCCQVYDSVVALANAAQVCNFSDVTISPSCPGGGIVTSYNCETVIDDSFLLGGNNQLYVCGPVKVSNTVINGTGTSNYQVLTSNAGQTTGLPIVAEFNNVTWQGSMFTAVDILQVNVPSSEFIFNACHFGGTTNDSHIFQETHSAAGTNTCRVIGRGNTFDGPNLAVHAHGGTGTNTTIIELSANTFLTTGSLNRALLVSANPVTRVHIHNNNFSTTDTPVVINSSVGLLDSKSNYGTNWSERTAVSGNYTATQMDELIAFTSTAAAYTVTPVAASSVPAGKRLIIKDESGAAVTNHITIAGTIDGATQSIATNYGVARLYSDGTAWHTW